MLFHELNRGSCKTYFLGCESARRAALIDPLRERVERYLAFLAYHGYRLELVIDTHSQADEYSGELGHVSGSRLIPLRELAKRAEEIADQKTKDVVCVCRAGVRSATAAAVLTGLGFEHVWNMKGGMLEWNEAGLPVER